MNLAVFGDSWVTGEGLGQAPGEISPYAFGNQLSMLLGASKFTNCGVAGSSNSRTVLELLKYTKSELSNNKHLAVFFITSPARSCIIDRDSSKIIDLHSGVNTTLGKVYTAYFSSLEYLNFECFKNILAMQQICKKYKINDYYIIGWDQVDINFPGIDRTKFYPKTASQLLGYKDQESFLKMPPNNYVIDMSKHPSVEGHKVISEALYNWILAGLNNHENTTQSH